MTDTDIAKHMLYFMGVTDCLVNGDDVTFTIFGRKTECNRDWIVARLERELLEESRRK